jgi:hypothetical protein
MVDYITIEDRNLLYKATIDLITLLQERVGPNCEDVNLTPMLFKRVWRAALKCKGFSPSMKDDIVYKCKLDSTIACENGLPPFAADWTNLWTIGPKPGTPNDLVLVSSPSLSLPQFLHLTPNSIWQH